MLIVAYKPFILNVVMRKVVMLSVVMLNVSIMTFYITIIKCDAQHNDTKKYTSIVMLSVIYDE
jgi:hypothetical protein